VLANRGSSVKKSRHFGTTTHIAQREHFCDRCFEYIFPGEMYERYCMLTGGKFLMLKEHVEPRCEFPEPPDDDDGEEEEVPEELPMAA